jgi:addiction module HigA family antidote
MKSKLLTNITPGEILVKEFLEPMRITQYRLAKDISVPARRINEIVKGQRAITADTALRLGRYFGMAPEFWLNLQSHYDLEQEQERLDGRLTKEVKVLALCRAGQAKPLSACLKSTDSAAGGRRLAEHLHSLPYPHYEPAPGSAGRLVRIEANGKRTTGRFVNRKFQPIKPASR